MNDHVSNRRSPGGTLIALLALAQGVLAVLRSLRGLKPAAT